MIRMHVCRIEMLQKEHPVYLETVTFSNIMKFTALQVRQVHRMHEFYRMQVL